MPIEETAPEELLDLTCKKCGEHPRLSYVTNNCDNGATWEGYKMSCRCGFTISNSKHIVLEDWGKGHVIKFIKVRDF